MYFSLRWEKKSKLKNLYALWQQGWIGFIFQGESTNLQNRTFFFPSKRLPPLWKNWLRRDLEFSLFQWTLKRNKACQSKCRQKLCFVNRICLILSVFHIFTLQQSTIMIPKVSRSCVCRSGTRCTYLRNWKVSLHARRAPTRPSLLH